MSTRLGPRGVGGRSDPQSTGAVCFPGFTELSLCLAALTRAACGCSVGVWQKRRAVVGRSHLRGDYVVLVGNGEVDRVLEAAARQRKSNYAFKPTADRALRSNQLTRRGGLMQR